MSYEFRVAQPGKFTGFDDLESLADRRAMNLINYFEEELVANSGVLGAELTLPLPVTVFGKLVSQLVAKSNEPDNIEAEHVVIAQAMKLGTLIADRLLQPKDYAMSFQTILEHGADNVAINYLVRQAPLDYLERRPKLSLLVDRYSAGFVKTYDAQQSAFIGAGIALAQIDERLLQQYTEQQIDDFSTEFAAWTNPPEASS